MNHQQSPKLQFTSVMRYNLKLTAKWFVDYYFRSLSVLISS